MGHSQGAFIPHVAALAAGGVTSEWRDAIEQALAFQEHDPLTAHRRLEQIEQRLREAMARSPAAAAPLEPWANYARSLLPSVRAAKSEWQAQSIERERQFRKREREQYTRKL